MMNPELAEDIVRSELRDDGILVVTVDNPPVNALSADVRRGLLHAIEAAEADPAVDGGADRRRRTQFHRWRRHSRIRQAAAAAVACPMSATASKRAANRW